MFKKSKAHAKQVWLSYSVTYEVLSLFSSKRAFLAFVFVELIALGLCVFCFFCSELSHKIKQHAVKIHINILIFSLLLGCNLKSNCRFGDMFLKKFTHFYWPSQIDTHILGNLFYSLIPLTLHMLKFT